jgi:two-component system phosphate regulon response regulator PhoB
MPKERILVVDDEADVRELVRYNLTREGYRVTCVSTGEAALDRAAKDLPDLVILDWLSPSVVGLEVCRRLKTEAKTRHIPVLMLTAKTEEADVVSGLELGADDHMTKPFRPRVLLARVKAVLRRQSIAPFDERSVVRIHALVIDPGWHEVLLAGKPLELTYSEFALLHFLARKPGWTFTRMQIVDAVKGEDYPVTERSVDVQIAGLRKKLGDQADYVQTVRGVGYRFKE